jgi:hypothetical protein
MRNNNRWKRKPTRYILMEIKNSPLRYILMDIAGYGT